MRRRDAQTWVARTRLSARAGTLALSLSYGTVGVFWGAWAVSLNEVLRAERLSPGEASIGLATFGLAALAAPALVRPRLRAVSRRGSICLALAVFAAGCLLLVVAPSPALVPGFSVAGLGAGVGDVAINAAGNELEGHVKRPVLQWVHGGYSAGAAVGALGAGIALSLAASYRTVLLTASVLPLLPVYVVSRAAALEGVAQERAEPAPGRARWFIPPPGLLLPAVVIVCGLLLEGSLDIWSALYLRRGLSASVLFAGASLAAFALSMAVGRTFTARVLFRFGYRKTIATSGVGTASLGVVLALNLQPVPGCRRHARARLLPRRRRPGGLRNDRRDARKPDRRRRLGDGCELCRPDGRGADHGMVCRRGRPSRHHAAARPPRRADGGRCPARALAPGAAARRSPPTAPDLDRLGSKHTKAAISSPSRGPREDRHRPG